MPDLTDYTDPFSRAARAMQGNRAMPPGPINPNPEPRRRRSLFDDPALQDLAGRLGTGTPGYLPTEMQPLGAEGGGGSPLVAAMKGPAGVPYADTATSSDIHKQIAAMTVPPGSRFEDMIAGMPTLDSAKGVDSQSPSGVAGILGGAAASPALQSPPQMKIQVGSADGSAPQAGSYYGPNNQYGMGPYRSNAEIKAAGTGDPIRDRLLAMLDQAPPSATLWSNVGGRDQPNPNFGAELAAYQGRLGSLGELMKSQNENAYRDKELALKGRSLDLAEKEAAYMKSPEKQRETELEKMQRDWAAQGMSPIDQALALGRVKSQWAAQDALRAAKGGGTTSSVTPGSGASAMPPPGPKTLEQQIAGIPESILAQLTTKDSKGDQVTRRLEDFMTQAALTAKDQPGLITPEMAPAIKELVRQKYGPTAMEQYLQSLQQKGFGYGWQKGIGDIRERLFGEPGAMQEQMNPYMAAESWRQFFQSQQPK